MSRIAALGRPRPNHVLETGQPHRLRASKVRRSIRSASERSLGKKVIRAQRLDRHAISEVTDAGIEKHGVTRDLSHDTSDFEDYFLGLELRQLRLRDIWCMNRYS